MLKIFFSIILLGGLMFSKKDRTKYLLICMFTFLACLGLRHSSCFGDTIGYVEKFEQLGSMSIYAVSDSFKKDPYFYVFSKIIHQYVSSNYTIWLFINGLIYVGALYLLLKKYSYSIIFKNDLFHLMLYFI